MPKLSFCIGFLWPKVLEKFGAADGYIRTNTVVTVSRNSLHSLGNNQLSTTVVCKRESTKLWILDFYKQSPVYVEYCHFSGIPDRC